MSIYMYICIYNVYICIYIHRYEYIYVYMYICIYKHTYIYRHIYIYMHVLYACTYVCICRQRDRVRMSRSRIHFERQRRKDVYTTILKQQKYKTPETHKRPDTPKMIPSGIFLFEECVCCGRSTCAEQLTKRFCVSILYVCTSKASNLRTFSSFISPFKPHISWSTYTCVCVCVFVCMCEGERGGREGEREEGREGDGESEREREGEGAYMC